MSWGTSKSFAEPIPIFGGLHLDTQGTPALHRTMIPFITALFFLCTKM